VGIDVERIASERNVTEIITRFFTRSERAYLLNLPTAERQTAFFRCWTCKEAQVKATGQGISEGLTQLDLAAMLKTAESLTYCDPWSIATLDLDDRWRDRYAAAIAVAGQNWQLKCWRYN
jgi:4'-phosphopantetheinyl transferase